jgi:polyisoprenoid-binding protein YceI
MYRFFHAMAFVAAGLCTSLVLSGSLLAGITVPPQETDETKVELTPVEISGDKVSLTPENTSVEFVGTHTGDEPRPRLGGFREFKGTMEVDAEAKTVESIEVEFDVTSIWTEFDNLTAHLKNPDFFEVEEFPTATFRSTSIKPGEDGSISVTGELTIHGTTGELTFDARPEFFDEGLVLQSDFSFDRTKYGLEKMTQGVEPEVSVSVVVGKATSPRKSQPSR